MELYTTTPAVGVFTPDPFMVFWNQYFSLVTLNRVNKLQSTWVCECWLESFYLTHSLAAIAVNCSIVSPTTLKIGIFTSLPAFFQRMTFGVLVLQAESFNPNMATFYYQDVRGNFNGVNTLDPNINQPTSVFGDLNDYNCILGTPFVQLDQFGGYY